MDFSIRDVHEDHEHLVFNHSGTSCEHIEKIAAKAGFKARMSGKPNLGKFGMVLLSGKSQVGHCSGVADFASDPAVTLADAANARKWWTAARELGATADASAEKALEAYVASGKGAAMAEVHGVGASRWNLLWLPFVVALIVGALGAVQRMGDIYTERTMSQILKAAATPHEAQSALAYWVTPDFSDRSTWKPYRFPYIRQDAAIVEEEDGSHLILMPGVGQLYRSDDAARTVNIPTYQINTEKGLLIEKVTREGATLASNIEFKAFRVFTEPAPPITPDGAEGTYNAGTTIVHDRTRSFAEIPMIAPVATVSREDDTYVVDAGQYKVPLRGPMTEGFNVFLDRVVARHETTTVYLLMEGEPLDWKVEGGKPGPRQTKKWIRYAEPAGLQAGKLMVKNSSS